MADAVVDVEELYDFGQFFAHERLAARNPKLVKLRSGAAERLDLLEREIASLVELVPVKTGAAERVAGRGHKQEDGLQSSRLENALRVMKVGEPHSRIIGAFSILP